MPGKATLVLLDEKAREFVSRGVKAIYEPVRRTLGPEGRNALLYRTFNRGPRITNDGVTVAEVIEPKNPFERLVANAFKEMAKRTNERVGDGTTTTVVIGGVLQKTIERLLGFADTSRFSEVRRGVMSIRQEILRGAEEVKKKILERSKKIESLEELEKIAAISVEDEGLGKLIAGMAYKVGVDGFIDVVEGYKGEVESELIEGMRFPAKVPGKAFVNNPTRYEMVMTQTAVLITNHDVDNASTLIEPLKNIGMHTRKLVIIAPNFSDNVLVNCVSAIKDGYFVYPVKAPGLRTEQMEDLAVYCGAKLIDKAKGRRLSAVTFGDTGYLEKLIVKDAETREDAIALGGTGTQQIQDSSAIQDRIKILKGQLEETHDIQFKRMLERRIASMASGGGIIRVGASSQAESLYLKLKIEDGVYACKAALRGGYVKGGGLCLKEISDELPENHILKECLAAPFQQIQENAGGNLVIGDDIIDPTEVVYYAVEHGTSVVAHLATVDILAPEEPETMNGEGEREIANAIMEFVLGWKRKEGLMTASQEEMARDRMTVDERIMSDNG